MHPLSLVPVPGEPKDHLQAAKLRLVRFLHDLFGHQPQFLLDLAVRLPTRALLHPPLVVPRVPTSRLVEDQLVVPFSIWLVVPRTLPFLALMLPQLLVAEAEATALGELHQ